MYFDAAAATPLHPDVKAEMIQLMDLWGNNNSKHEEGHKAQKVINQSLKTIAGILNVSADQLAITYAGTDSNRRMIHEAVKKFGAENIFCSHIEHSSILDEIPESQRFDPENFSGLPEEPQFIALMRANSETGSLYDLSKLRTAYPNAFIHSDLAQVIGKGVDLQLEHVDSATFVPQKFYGPKHVGLLYLKHPEHFSSISKDSHTKNAFLIAGMAKAFELLDEKQPKKLKAWTDQIEHFISENIPDFKIHQKNKSRVPGILNIAFKGVRGSELMTLLSEEESICISTGSACTSDIMTPTHVIQYLEPNANWQYPIRISLHQFLTDENITDFCEVLSHYVAELRQRNF